MTTTARRARKDIREDQLVTSAVRISEWAQTHFNQVIIGVVALVAIVAVLVFTANSRENSAREGERQMGSALTLYQQGDFTAARESFQQIVERHGGRQAAGARFMKAECELRLGNNDQAVADYDAYLARPADDGLFRAAAHIGRALAFEGLGNYAEAAASMMRALDVLDPKDPRYYDAAFRAGVFFDRAGNRDEALRHYQLVAKDATGDLKERAAVAASLLE